MSKLGIALTALNGLFFAGSLGLSPIAPPAFAQFLATSFNIRGTMSPSLRSTNVQDNAALLAQGMNLDTTSYVHPTLHGILRFVGRLPQSEKLKFYP
ncbi:hypothetical protein [Rhizobium leguminosarum]